MIKKARVGFVVRDLNNNYVGRYLNYEFALQVETKKNQEILKKRNVQVRKNKAEDHR